MKTTSPKQKSHEWAKALRTGDKIIYNDGREGHKDVDGVVLSHYSNGMAVQFEDRAAPNTILFNEAGWMDFLKPAPMKKFAPDKGKNDNAYSNGERAERGQEMVALHPDQDGYDTAVDALADILHYIHREGHNPEQAVKTALMHYNHEA